MTCYAHNRLAVAKIWTVAEMSALIVNKPSYQSGECLLASSLNYKSKEKPKKFVWLLFFSALPFLQEFYTMKVTP